MTRSIDQYIVSGTNNTRDKLILEESSLVKHLASEENKGPRQVKVKYDWTQDINVEAHAESRQY